MLRKPNGIRPTLVFPSASAGRLLSAGRAAPACYVADCNSSRDLSSAPRCGQGAFSKEVVRVRSAAARSLHVTQSLRCAPGDLALWRAACRK